LHIFFFTHFLAPFFFLEDLASLPGNLLGRIPSSFSNSLRDFISSDSS
jgi:hypothetical protein